MKISAPCYSHVLHFSISTSGIKDFMIKHFRYLPLFSPRSLGKFAGKLRMEFCGIWIRHSRKGLQERILAVSVYKHQDGSQNSQEMKWSNDAPNNLLKILQQGIEPKSQQRCEPLFQNRARSLLANFPNARCAAESIISKQFHSRSTD